MRVLLPVLRNQVFPREQAETLAEYCEVVTSFEDFWENREQFDIVQLNWPEELTQWREPTDMELVFLRRVLKQWGETSRIVVTRHNFHPHYADTERYRELYEIVYSAAHAVVHMGEYSASEYQNRFYGNDFLAEQVQKVIPHPILSSYPDNVTRSVARENLGIAPGTFVLLAFGRVQSAAEKNLLINAFSALPPKKKMVIVPGWKEAKGKEPVNRLKWANLNLSKRFRHYDQFVPEAEISKLFRAADLVLIPRIDTLNSGLVSLCIKFDCPMISPDCGNLSELAEAMGCPTFDPNNRASLIQAILESMSSDRESVSYVELRDLFRPQAIAKQYLKLYESIGRRT